MYFKRGYWKIADWHGAPVLLHASLLFWPLLEWLFGAKPFDALMALPAFVILMAVHELGHAAVARRCGLRTDSIRLLLLHGRCAVQVAQTELDAVLIAWGGVAAQMALLAIATAVLLLLDQFAPQTVHVLQPVFIVLIGVNVATSVVNLLPLKGLDGRTAWLIVVIALVWMRSRTREGYAAWAAQRQAVRRSKDMANDLIERIKNK